MKQLCRHFFNWANGDSALTCRTQTLSRLDSLFLFPLSLLVPINPLLHLFFTILAMFACDVIVDTMSWWG